MNTANFHDVLAGRLGPKPVRAAREHRHSTAVIYAGQCAACAERHPATRAKIAAELRCFIIRPETIDLDLAILEEAWKLRSF